ncbi:hypothetical protein K6025_01300 [Ehrlichia sp. JZT12]
MLKRITQCIAILYLCIIFPYSGFSKSECSDASQFYTLDTINKHPYPFCDVIFREGKALDFRIVPFYMQSFFAPKLFLVHPSQGLKLVPESDDYVSRDFESMMQKKTSNNLQLSLKNYDITYYGIHRHSVNNFNNVCVYYEYRGQCIRQCLPIPALKRPKLEREGENITVKVNVRKPKENVGNSSTQIEYTDEERKMSVSELQSLVSEDIKVVSPKLDMQSHEFQSLTTCSNSSNAGHTTQDECSNTNIKCLKGLNYSGLGYYIRRYDKSVGGHRYFWVRPNKRKLVRHRYNNGKYYPCDDSMSYNLDNITMRSFLASIIGHDDHYIIPRSGYRIAKYKENKEENLCRNSELYFDSTTVLERIRHDKECIFGKVQYSSDEEEHIKSCSYNYVSDDFETFGVNRNKNELKDTDFFLVNNELKSTDFFLVNNGSLDGLTPRDQYLEGMCVDKFPQYEYRVKRHMNGFQRNRYIYHIGDYQPESFYQCDFIKIEAWGGGQAGYIENGRPYSGTPGHYTFGILKVDQSKGKKLIIHVGEGGRYPGEYGGDTVVALCDSNGNNCETSLVARGCTHDSCAKNNSSISDNIVKHYRSVTGMDFSEHKPMWLENNRLIPWGNPDFPDGVVRLSADDCSGPVNAFEKNPNEYPGAGGCASLRKSIQQGADGLVRLTCEVWDTPITLRQDTRRYHYNKERDLLCNQKEKNEKGGCLKAVCIYPSGDSEKLRFPSPITMFGGEQCEAIRRPMNAFIVNLLNSGKSMKVSLENDSGSNTKHCYDNNQGLSRLRVYRVLDVVKRTAQTRSGHTINYKQCWGAEGHGNVALSCYRSKFKYLELSANRYVCCYHDITDKAHEKDVCWSTTGKDILKEFASYDLPDDLPIALRQDFYDGSVALLSNLSQVSNVIQTPKSAPKKIQKKAEPKQPIENPQYAYNKEKGAFCLNYEGMEGKGCIKSICGYTAKDVEDTLSKYIGDISSKVTNVCPLPDEIEREDIIINYDVGTKVQVSCKTNGECCYVSEIDITKKSEPNKQNGEEVEKDKNKEQCWSSNDNPSLLCYETKLFNEYKGYVCCYGQLEDYKVSRQKGVKNDKHVCWFVNNENQIKEMFDKKSLDDYVVDISKLIEEQDEDNTDESLQSKTVAPHIDSIQYTEKRLQYAYYPKEKTFCLDTTDRNVKNKGCLSAVCIHSTNPEKADAPDYRVFKGTSNDLCPPLAKLKSKSPTGHINVSCKDGKCCYSNTDKAQRNKTRNQELCLQDSNVVLSCYKNASSGQNQSNDYDYTCCYSSIESYKSHTGVTGDHVCWKAGKNIWQILGYYKLPEDIKKQVKEEHKKTKEHGKVVMAKRK